MDPLVIALAFLWIIVLALLVVVFALARQVGVLFERVAPMGALITDGGPKIGEAGPRFDLVTLDGAPLAIGGATLRTTLIFFLSNTCPVCKKLFPVLKSLVRDEGESLDIVLASDGERAAHEAFRKAAGIAQFPYVLSSTLGMTYRINRLPFAVLLDSQGIVRAKGLVNSREQLESLINARELGSPSIQSWIDARADGRI
jgi:methylamine dehydrogenase accessory protein MauD